MKKLILILTMAVACIASASAINIKEAFSALSNLPSVSVTENLDLKDFTDNKCPVKLEGV